MDDKALIAKIKELKNIKPDKQWVVFCCVELKEKIAGIEQTNGVSVWQYLFARPALVGIATFILALTSGFAVIKVAQGSLPGDSLYPVKLALERAELKITTEGVAKTKFQAELTGRRAQELTEVAKLPLSLREQKMAETVDQIEQQLSATQNSLPALREKIKSGQDVDSGKMAEAAQAAKENTTKLKEAIEQTKGNVSEIPESGALSARISDISEKLRKTHNEISEIIENIESASGDVGKQKKNSDDNTTTTPIILPEK